MDTLDRLPAALHAVAPWADASVWTDALTPSMHSCGLTTPRRAAMFLGQFTEECGFRVFRENLNYSADGLRSEWPHLFAPAKGKPGAESYAHQPERIANYVYSSVCHPYLGNGDEASGDGWLCRGVGGLQLTGRYEISRFATAVGMTLEAAIEWMQTPPGAARSSCWYWLDRGHLLEMSDAWDIEAVTVRINGGKTNLPLRISLCNKALAAFGDDLPEPHTEPTADELNAAWLAAHPAA